MPSDLTISPLSEFFTIDACETRFRFTDPVPSSNVDIVNSPIPTLQLENNDNDRVVVHSIDKEIIVSIDSSQRLAYIFDNVALSVHHNFGDELYEKRVLMEYVISIIMYNLYVQFLVSGVFATKHYKHIRKISYTFESRYSSLPSIMQIHVSCVRDDSNEKKEENYLYQTMLADLNQLFLCIQPFCDDVLNFQCNEHHPSLMTMMLSSDLIDLIANQWKLLPTMQSFESTHVLYNDVIKALTVIQRGCLCVNDYAYLGDISFQMFLQHENILL